MEFLNFLNRNVEHKDRFRLLNISDQSLFAEVDAIPSPGNVLQQGTAQTAENMNKLASRVVQKVQDTGSANSLQVSINGLTSKSQLNNTILAITVSAQNTGSVTINYNALGSEPLGKYVGGSFSQISSGELTAGSTILVIRESAGRSIVVSNISNFTPESILDMLLTVDSNSSGLNCQFWQGLEPSSKLNTSAYTAQDVLNKLLTVDSDSSGLNCQFWQGLEPSSKLNTSAYTAQDVLAKLLTVDSNDSGLNSETVSGFKFFGSVDDLGFTPGSETINGMIQAMPNLSVLNCFIGSTYNTSEYPAIGTLHIVRVNEFRTFLEFRHFNDSKRVWKGVYYTESGTGTFREWEAPLIQGEYGEMMYESNSFTVGAGHKNKHVLCTNDTNITITVPQTDDYVAGDYIVFTRDRSATVQFVASGVTLFSIDSQRSIGNRFGDVVLKKRYNGLAGSWQLTGDLA